MKVSKGKVVWAVCILSLFNSGLAASAASSDGFPWSNSQNWTFGQQNGVERDSYGALKDSDMLPDSGAGAVSQSTARPLLAPGALSSGFPPGSFDRNFQTGQVPPGSSFSAAGVAQGNVGPTQSGPGAVGLFTPSNPGNLAAYNAQLNGALQGSPIRRRQRHEPVGHGAHG